MIQLQIKSKNVHPRKYVVCGFESERQASSTKRKLILRWSQQWVCKLHCCLFDSTFMIIEMHSSMHGPLQNRNHCFACKLSIMASTLIGFINVKFRVMLFCAASLPVDYKGGLFFRLNCQVTKQTDTRSVQCIAIKQLYKTKYARCTAKQSVDSVS